MKLKFLFAFAATATMLLSACSSDDTSQEPSSYGKVKAQFTADYGVTSSSKSPSRTVEVITPDVANFFIHLTKSDGSYDKTWSSVGEFPTNQNFLIGTYTMEAYYGSIDEEGFDKPYYYGSTTFDVKADEQATPSITATLANTMVSVDYTDAFKAYFTDYKTRIHSAGGAYIDFEKGEQRAAYVKPGNIAMEMTMTKTNGQTMTFEPATIQNAAARTHYHITFDVNGGEVGDATLKITFDESTEVEPIQIVLSDELFSAAAPTVKANGFTSGEAVRYYAGESATSTLSAQIVAHAGLQEVTLTTVSPYLISRGWPAEIDLVNATEAQKTLLANLGLKVAGVWNLTSTRDNFAVIDFTGLIANLRPYSGTSTHEFTVVVKDRFTKVSDPVTLKVETPNVVLQLSDPSTVFTSGTKVSVTVNYDGNDLQNNVKFQATNASGQWTECTINSVESTGTNTYRVNLTIPATSGTQSLKAVYKTDIAESDAISIAKSTVTISAAEGNVWARRATVAVASSSADASTLVQSGTLYIAKSGDSYAAAGTVSKSGSNIVVSDLTPGTTYKAKLVLGGDYSGESNEVQFTTEAATQLPNADMEAWTSDKVGPDGSAHSSAYWTNYYPWSSDASTQGWNTLNFYTLQNCTGIGGNYCYVATTGTIPTDDFHGGSTAALIRTVAWGTGNTAGGALSVVNNVSAGELYLGTYSTDSKSPTYGYTFTSRPSNLQFYYKYTPKNSADHGLAQINVLDASGNTIATGSLNISGTVSSYTLATINLSYSGTAKAASIQVIFRSCDDSSYLNRSNVTLPGFGFGYESYTTTGSVLQIDDIVLGY